MRDNFGIPLARGTPLSGDQLRSNPPPGPSAPPRPFSTGHWQGHVFLCAGIVAAILLANAAVRSVVGLSSAEKPTPMATIDIPSFSALIDCNAHFSHEILRIKNKLPAHNTTAELPLLHRNYRRLHRLMRQVGRRDDIASAIQTDRLRRRVRQLNQFPGKQGAAARDYKCRAMAKLPIASKRHSQRILGH
jgi:hypothetical protein